MIKVTFSALLLSAVFCQTVMSQNDTHHHDEDHNHTHFVDTFQRQQLTDVYFSEGASAGDIDGDGVADVVYGPYWFKGPEFTAKREIYPAVPQNRNGYADNFFSWVYDFDSDGNNDILTVVFPGKPGYVYRNPGKADLDNLWERIEILDSVSNESPQFTDINGDGKPELICTRHGHYGFAQFDPAVPFQAWKFSSISGDVAPKPFGHGLGVGDVNNDGRMDMIARNGWFAQPVEYAANEDWPFHAVEFAPASSDMFAYDVDGDGDNDIITSLSAHDYGLAWYESSPGDNGIPAFEQHLIMGREKSDNSYGVLFTEPHAVQMADMNGDGLLDIVTGKTYWSHHTQSPLWDAGAVVYWFELHRDEPGKVDFVPRKADGESGIGRGLFVADINGDNLPDIVTGGMKGAHVLTHVRKEVSPAEYDLAQPRKRQPMAEGLPPIEAAAHMTVPPGFKVELAAGEPMVHQPIAMCFDHKGRLWVAEGHTYPNRAPQGEGKDRIVIFEDTTGDGLFDKSKTFIEGLNLVSGLEVGFGGVYVGAAPYLMFIPDADGDDSPDMPGAPAGDGVGRRVSANDGANAEFAEQRQSTAEVWKTQLELVQFPKDVPPGATVLCDGFGWHDTHETLNAFIWGPDGWLYGCHGVFTHSNVGKPGTPDAERQGLNAGVWRYHPVRHEFEVFAHGTSNPWGVDFNDHGQAFISACVIPHLWHMVQGGRYHRQGGQHFNKHTYDDIKTIADHAHYVGNIRDHAWWGHEPKAAGGTDAAGGGHAHAGAMIYLGNQWPAEYRNKMFFNNIHGNRINMEMLEKIEGESGYVGRHGDDFMFANDHYYRGINLRYGPDGSVYVIDWYDKNACHRTNPEIWDRSNGRIYRISYQQSGQEVASTAAGQLETIVIDTLIAEMENPNEWNVRMARKGLMELQASGKKLTAAQLQTLRNNASNKAKPVDRRLRSLWTLGALQLIDDEFAAELLYDKEAMIRAWTIQLLMERNEPTAGQLRKMQELAMDDQSAVVRMYLASALQRLPLEQRWSIAGALAQRAEDADDHNIPLLLWYGIEPLVVEDTPMAMELAAVTKIPLLRKYIVRRASAQNETIGPVVAALNTATAETQLEFLDEMLAAFEGRVAIPMPDAWLAAYEKLSTSGNEALQDKANQLAIIFGDQRVFPLMRNLLADASQDIKRRQQALNVLVRGQDKASSAVLLADSVLNNAELQGPAVRALSTLGGESVAQVLLASYSKFPAAIRNDVISTLVSRPDWTTALLKAIGSKAVPSSDLGAYHVRQVLAFKNDSINELLKTHWGEIRETSGDRKQQMAEWKQVLNPEFMAKAHPGNGRRVFSKTCQNCHKLFGTGGEIGPDITGSNRANLDYILENALDPSAVVGRSYQMTVVALESGRVVSGLLKNESDSAITIQTINDTVVVPKSEIEERSLSDVSMMPERQFDALSKTDVRDLIAYLASPNQVTMSGPAPVLEKDGKVAGALEGENAKIVEKTDGTSRNQGMGGFSKGVWSGKDQLWWTGGKPGSRLAVEITVPEDGVYTVETAFTMAPDYAIIKLSIDDQIIDSGLDLFNAPDVISTGVLSYPSVKLTKGVHRFTMEVTGANPKAVKTYMVGLDFVKLVAE
ncbi:MAG: PVC-type heme-binding CxxCH protein [Fuerstiella sp.]